MIGIVDQIKYFFGNKEEKRIDAKNKALYKNPAIAPSIAHQHIKGYYKHRRKTQNATFCYAPHKNLYFTSLGEVVVCCHNRDFVVGRYPEQSIKEILTGERLKELRTYVYQNNLSKGCQVCQYDVDRGSYSQVKANHFDSLPYLDDQPTMMEFELDITCNLECTMCSGNCASLIRKNREGRPPLVTKYDDQFIHQLKPYLANLHEARFSGGEPFLINMYYDIWSELISINSNCLISIQTNGTVLNNKVKNIMEQGRFEIGISLDSLQKDVFESIRVNAKFETVMNNLEYFSDYCKRKETPFRLSICVMRNNWMDLPEYIKLCNKLQAYASFHKVTSPQELSLKTWDVDKLQNVNDFLKGHNFKGNTPLEKINADHYKQYAKLIELWLKNRKKEVQDAKNAVELNTATVPELRKQLLTDQLSAAELLEIDSETKDQLYIKIKNIVAAIPEGTDEGVYLKMLKTPAKEYIDKFLHLSEEQLKEKFHQNFT